MKRILALLMICLLVLTGCAATPAPEQDMQADPTLESTVSESSPTITPSPESEEPGDADEPRSSMPSPEEYVVQVVQETIDRITKPGINEYEKTKAAVDYLIEIGDYQWPIVLDIWRIRSTDDSTPSYVETRAVSFLLYGVGACEDYAATLVMLLEGMGIEARYMPGVTWGRNGGLIYHAWTQAKVDGVISRLVRPQADL